MIVESLTVFPYKAIWLGVILGEGCIFLIINSNSLMDIGLFNFLIFLILVSYLFLENNSNFVMFLDLLASSYSTYFVMIFKNVYCFCAPPFTLISVLFVFMFYPMIGLNHKIVYFFLFKNKFKVCFCCFFVSHVINFSFYIYFFIQLTFS